MKNGTHFVASAFVAVAGIVAITILAARGDVSPSAAVAAIAGVVGVAAGHGIGVSALSGVYRAMAVALAHRGDAGGGK